MCECVKIKNDLPSLANRNSFQLFRLLCVKVFHASALDTGITKHLQVPALELLFVAKRSKLGKPCSRHQVTRHHFSAAFTATLIHFPASIDFLSSYNLNSYAFSFLKGNNKRAFYLRGSFHILFSF